MIIWKSYFSDRIKQDFFPAVAVSVQLYGCTAWTLTRRLETKLYWNCKRCCVLFWTKFCINTKKKKAAIRLRNSHLTNKPYILFTAGELKRYSWGAFSCGLIHSSVGLTAKTNIHQLCTDTGCHLEDLPRKIDERWEKFKWIRTAASKVDNFADSLFFFFLLIIMRSGLLAGIRWSIYELKSHWSLCESFSRTGAGLCIYHLFVWSNWNFLHISQWITLPTQSCLVLFSFCANLLHSLIMWLIVSSLSPHSIYLLFCCVLSILALIWLVLMVLSCAAIRRDSVSHLKFPFHSQVEVFWWEMLFTRRLKRP